MSVPIYYWSSIWRGSPTLWEAGVPFLGRSFSVYCYFLLFRLLDFWYIGFVAYSISLYICYHCVRYLCHIV